MHVPQRHEQACAVMIDIDAERACWQLMDADRTSELVFLFHEWEPAIRVGIHAYLAYPGRDFESIEPAIDAAYQRIRGPSPIPWSLAAPAARRVWQKLHRDSARESVWYADPSAIARSPACRQAAPLAEA
jgi:hypothetical protein